MSSTLVGASAWEEELYSHLSHHAAEEQKTIERYRQLAAESESEAFRYLVGQIVEDEKRHHQWMADLAATIKAASDMSEPALPVLDLGRAGPGVAAATAELLDVERGDRKALKALERQLDDVKDTTIWALIVRLMVLETDKHIAILDFVRRHARAR